MIISVCHPKLPFGRAVLPLASVVLYLGAWCARVGLAVSPRLRKRLASQGCPMNPEQAGRFVTRLAWELLWSGSYVLCDLEVAEGKERVRIKVRLV